MIKIIYDEELQRLRLERVALGREKRLANRKYQLRRAERSITRQALTDASATHTARSRLCASALEELRAVRSDNSKVIDELIEVESQLRNDIKAASTSAKEAYRCREGRAAAEYARISREYRLELNDCASERRQLMQQVTEARIKLQRAQGALNQARLVLQQANDKSQRAELAAVQSLAVLTDCSSRLTAVTEAFNKRMADINSGLVDYSESHRRVARAAAVPEDYVNEAIVDIKLNGTVNIYFGGLEKPDGFGHGHYVVDPDGQVAYSRNPSL